MIIARPYPRPRQCANSERSHDRTKAHQAPILGLPSAWKTTSNPDPYRKTLIPTTSASALIDAKIASLPDWRGETLAKLRAMIHAADPEILEEWKWMGTPVFSHAGIICTGETYKTTVKMTFAKGASLPDPSAIFNSSLDGNVRRAIDIYEGEEINESALTDLIRAAVAFNLTPKPKSKRKPNTKTS